jgi:Ca2+-binding EF-hand superfamily protein
VWNTSLADLNGDWYISQVPPGLEKMMSWGNTVTGGVCVWDETPEEPGTLTKEPDGQIIINKGSPNEGTLLNATGEELEWNFADLVFSWKRKNGTTILSKDAKKGDTTIEIASKGGFKISDTIRIGYTFGHNVETHHLEEWGSMVLDSPLAHDRPKGTPVESIGLFDCDAGFKNWRRGWSPAKKEYCCKDKRKGCENLWGDELCHAWVSQANTRCYGENYQHNCQKRCWGIKEPPPPTFDCDIGQDKFTGLRHVQDAWPSNQSSYCCTTAQVGCVEKLFDCLVGVEKWETGWSDEKKSWCCFNEKRGCPEAEFDCQAGRRYWKRGWSQMKKTWCCDNEHIPETCTPTPKPMSTTTGVPLAIYDHDHMPGGGAWNAAQANHAAVGDTNLDTLSEEAMDAVEPGFDDFDVNHDGYITVNEAATYGVRNGVPWGEIQPIFKVMDADGDNKIIHGEFEKAYPVSHAMFQDFRAGYKDIDLDHDGVITNNEWMSYCSGWMDPVRPDQATCQDLFKAADKFEPFGEIDKHEFETAGHHCHSVDDKHCATLLALKRAAAVPRGSKEDQASVDQGSSRSAIRTGSLRGVGK